MSEHHHDHAHDHNHDHGHDHGHDHAHDHHDGDTYYLDQICMVGVSGAFGAICLALYIQNARAADDAQPMLRLLLGPQFHLFVLGSGIALVLVAIVRAVMLWRSAGRPAHAHTHHPPEHPHQHDHHHEHEHTADCGHEHAVSAHEPGHAHAHSHDHAHHGHDHGPEDHDHGWAPWRYVLLLVPIILFLLGLPNKGPQAKEVHIQVDPTREMAAYAGMIGGAQANQGEVLSWLAALYMTEEEGTDVLFKDLENYASRPDLRAEKQGKTVRVRGQYAPSRGSDHVFSLQRYRISCCAADAIPLDVPIVTRESLATRAGDLKINEWVKVTGVIDFQQIGGQYKTVLRVLNLARVQKCPPDSNPYIQ